MKKSLGISTPIDKVKLFTTSLLFGDDFARNMSQHGALKPRFGVPHPAAKFAPPAAHPAR